MPMTFSFVKEDMISEGKLSSISPNDKLHLNICSHLSDFIVREQWILAMILLPGEIVTCCLNWLFEHPK